MKGTLYGVGVGPGDPELMTLRAVRLVRENEVIACPGKDARETVAYQIALRAEPTLKDKTLLSVEMPMTLDPEALEQGHRKAAEMVESQLSKGQNVVFLTLGDPSIYSTYLYVQKRVAAHGYQTELVPGVTSFCAAAARANVSLAEWEEQLHIVPAVHRLDKGLDLPDNYILMKSGRKMKEVKELLRQSGKDIVMVENCGMPDEHIYRSVDGIPDDAGYYSLIIAKEPKP